MLPLKGSTIAPRSQPKVLANNFVKIRTGFCLHNLQEYSYISELFIYKQKCAESSMKKKKLKKQRIEQSCIQWCFKKHSWWKTHDSLYKLTLIYKTSKQAPIQTSYKFYFARPLLSMEYNSHLAISHLWIGQWCHLPCYRHTTYPSWQSSQHPMFYRNSINK